MNRSDLINALKDEMDLTRKDAEQVVHTFFEIISEALKEGDRVEIYRALLVDPKEARRRRAESAS